MRSSLLLLLCALAIATLVWLAHVQLALGVLVLLAGLHLNMVCTFSADMLT